MLAYIALTVIAGAVITITVTALWPRKQGPSANHPARRAMQQELYRLAFEAAVTRDIDAVTDMTVKERIQALGQE